MLVPTEAMLGVTVIRGPELTLLSKTTDVPEVGLEITRQAIEMKTEIEKLREQAQNIE